MYAGDRTTTPNEVYVPSIRHSMSSDVKIYNNILPLRSSYANEDSSSFFDNTTYSLMSGDIASLLANPFGDNPTRATLPL